MLDFSLGVACGAHIFLYLTPDVTCSHYLSVFVIKMWKCPVGVACSAKQFLYFTPKVNCSCYFCFWDARRSKKLKHFGPKRRKSWNMTNNQCSLHVPSMFPQQNTTPWRIWPSSLCRTNGTLPYVYIYIAVSHLWDWLETCHKGFPGLFVKFNWGPTRALGLAQQGPRGGP